jgi:NAD(P)-dependent dehydrogenase (short-subunit alcohol dehydrogenase family)
MSGAAGLAGQLAWVTGGGSGIGLAGAVELAKAGCRVVVSGRDGAKLDAAIAAAEARGRPAERSPRRRSTSPHPQRSHASPPRSRRTTAGRHP